MSSLLLEDTVPSLLLDGWMMDDAGHHERIGWSPLDCAVADASLCVDYVLRTNAQGYSKLIWVGEHLFICRVSTRKNTTLLLPICPTILNWATHE